MPVHSSPADVHPTLERSRRHNEHGDELVAERAAIERHREMVNFLGTGDTTTRRAFEAILAAEEEDHPEDWLSFLEGLGVQPPARR